jgi:hypothetical protein
MGGTNGVKFAPKMKTLKSHNAEIEEACGGVRVQFLHLSLSLFAPKVAIIDASATIYRWNM